MHPDLNDNPPDLSLPLPAGPIYSQLWGEIYCLLPETVLKRFEMAAWVPTEIHVHLFTPNEEKMVEASLDSLRDTGKPRCSRIRTLEFRGEIDVCFT